MIRAVLTLLVLSCIGCTSFQNPIVGKHGPRFDAALTGRWVAVASEGTIEIDIRPVGREGLVIADATQAGEAPEHTELRLITAKLERITYGSVQEHGKPKDSWNLFQYEIVGDRLVIRSDNSKFWSDAIRDKLVTGTIEKKDWTQSVTVTASEQELRAVVLGYGSVIFNSEPLLEFQRKGTALTTPSRP